MTGRVWELLAGHWQMVALVGLGVVAGLVAVTRLVRRRPAADHVVTRVASLVALVLSADGGYRLMRTGLDLPVWEAAVVCALAELALVAEALRAERSIREHGHPGGHHLAVWGIAVGAGVVVSSSAEGVPAHLVRLAVPVVAALLWWMGVREDRRARPEAVTWLVSPRRIGVALRLIRPGADDLVAHDAHLRAARLARLLHRHGTAGRRSPLAGWRTRRIHRHAETVGPEVIAEVRAQVVRTAELLGLAGLAGPVAAVAGYGPPAAEGSPDSGGAPAVPGGDDGVPARSEPVAGGAAVEAVSLPELVAAGDVRAVLDMLQVPLTAGRTVARTALSGVGMAVSTADLSAVLRDRKPPPVVVNGRRPS